jgi:hypothetical protein
VVLRHGGKKVVQAALLSLLVRAAVLPDADGDGVQESFTEEIAGMLIEEYTKFLEKAIDGLPKEEKERMRGKFSLKDLKERKKDLANFVQESPKILASMQYSRAMELEADQVAQAACRVGACPIDAVSSSLTKIMESEAPLPKIRRIVEEAPLIRFGLSHPPLRVREAALQHVRVPTLVSPKNQ